MWDEISDLLDSAVEWLRYGWLRISGVLLAILGILVGVGLIDLELAKILSIILIFAIAVLVVSYYGLQLRAARATLRERERVLNRYINHFRGTSINPDFAISDFEESTTITKNGDAIVERWVTITVSRELYSCWTSNFQFVKLNRRQQRKVRVQARSFDPANKNLGVRYDVTAEWEISDASTHCVNIHFHTPAASGTSQSIWIKWVWPGFYGQLLDGETVTMDWVTLREFGRIKSTLTFDKSCKIGQQFACTPHPNNPAPSQRIEPDGSVTVTWERHNVPAGTTAGYRLERS